ncbi:MAG: hypothetical protein ACE367_12540 [Acidimicrobiales bacterium]
MSDETVTAKEAIETVLAHRVKTEPGFLERLVLDPNTTAKPVIEDVLVDDGAIDMGGMNVVVHIETDDTIHLVVPIRKDDPDLAEVSGFGQRRFDLRQARTIGPGPVLSASDVKYTETYLCTSSGICVCTGPDECSDGLKASF